ncbi:hypothetical protein ACFPT7_16285 [Acidicapsa dinghuensis]|uniref:Uncharacterized protein n=1 Tax=Acidicapsa dinghuensis TaxID=2218256 RepID=A0ABW1EIE1_9BACT|nr:hypothetical protein [Acidicapsa dinghuensis]
MTPENFVNALKVQTSDAAVRGTVAQLRAPSGRKPDPKLVMLSEWFNELSSSDQEHVTEVIRQAAQLAVFGFFCVLDGVTVFEDGPNKGDLKLIYSNRSETLVLNNPQVEFLHDIYNSKCEDSV